MMSRFCSAETQDTEGLNSTVKLFGRRCRHHIGGAKQPALHKENDRAGEQHRTLW